MIEFKHSPKSLCIFRLSAIGDVTHILPVIHTLKKVWPETKITWVIGKLEHQLIKALADVAFNIFDKFPGRYAFPGLLQQLNVRCLDLLFNDAGMEEPQ